MPLHFDDVTFKILPCAAHSSNHERGFRDKKNPIKGLNIKCDENELIMQLQR